MCQNQISFRMSYIALSRAFSFQWFLLYMPSAFSCALTKSPLGCYFRAVYLTHCKVRIPGKVLSLWQKIFSHLLNFYLVCTQINLSLTSSQDFGIWPKIIVLTKWMKIQHENGFTNKTTEVHIVLKHWVAHISSNSSMLANTQTGFSIS